MRVIMLIVCMSMNVTVNSYQKIQIIKTPSVAAKNQKKTDEKRTNKQKNKHVPEHIKKLMNALAHVESRGKGYSAIGKTTKNGTPLGKHQVMSSNLQNWAKQAGFQTMTVAVFMKNPWIQDVIVSYQIKKIYTQYGNWYDTASVWHTGKPLGDSLFSTNRKYIETIGDHLGEKIPDEYLSFKDSDHNMIKDTVLSVGIDSLIIK